MKHFLTVLMVLILSMILTACGGGGSEVSTVEGSAAKGPFVVKSRVVVYRLNTNGTRSRRDTVKGKVIRNDGSYRIERIPWSGFSEMEITGQYLNENTGKLNAQLSLTAVFPAAYGREGTINVNVLTHFVAKRTKILMKNGMSAYDAEKKASKEIMGFFGLNVDPKMLNPIDNTGKYAAQNAELLRISAAISSQPALLKDLADALTDDGKINQKDKKEMIALLQFDRAIRKVEPKVYFDQLKKQHLLEGDLKEWSPKPLESLPYLQTYTIGGTIAKLRGTLKLKNRDGEVYVVHGGVGEYSGGFRFEHAFISGKRYAVTVVETPTDQDCDIVRASGIVNEKDVSDIQVTCRPKSYLVGGTVTGLDGTVKVELSAGSNSNDLQSLEVADISDNGVFMFAEHHALTDASFVRLKIKQNPMGQTCSVSDFGSNYGYIDQADYTSFRVQCFVRKYRIEGTVEGEILEPVTMAVNGSHQDGSVYSYNVAVEKNSSHFVISDGTEYGATVNITLVDSYKWRTCVLSEDHFVVDGAINDLKLTCHNRNYRVGAEVDGKLSDDTLKLQLNHAYPLAVGQTGQYFFDLNQTIVHNFNYAVDIVDQPEHYTCSTGTKSGRIMDHDISVPIHCRGNKYPIKIDIAADSDRISSLNIQPGGQDLSYVLKLKDTAYKIDMATYASGATIGEEAYGEPYAVEISSVPGWTQCSLQNASGIVSETNKVTLKCKNRHYHAKIDLRGFDFQPEELNVTLQTPAGKTVIPLSADGVYPFDANITYGMEYRLALDVPKGIQCRFLANTMQQISDINYGQNIEEKVVCQSDRYTIFGTYTVDTDGAPLRSAVVLQNTDTNETFTVNQMNLFMIKSGVKYGYRYNFSILKQPDGQTCTLSNASGIVQDDVKDINLSCRDNSYTVGGHLKGLYSGSELGLVISARKNADMEYGHVQAISLTEDGAYHFDQDGNISMGAAEVMISIYHIPEGQTCSLSLPYRHYTEASIVIVDSNGTEYYKKTNYYWYIRPYPAHDLLDFNITCQNKHYTLEGDAYDISRVVDYDDTVTLALDNEQVVAKPGSNFFFSDREYGSSYTVDIASQPSYVACWVENAQGIVYGDIKNIHLECSKTPYFVGGDITGLEGILALKMHIYSSNTHSSTLELTGEGHFIFEDNATLVHGDRYQIEVVTQPEGQQCQFGNHNTDISGTIDDSNVTNISVTCMDANSTEYTVGGSMQGASGTVVLRLNNSEDLTVDTNGTFVFSDKIASGNGYDVSVSTSPGGQVCTVTHGSGVVAYENITDVYVKCQSDTTMYHLGGMISGLDESDAFTLYVSAGGTSQDRALRANGSFDLGEYRVGSSYQLRVSRYPQTQRCVISPTEGIMNEESNTTVSITCTDNPYTLQARIHNLNDTIKLSAQRDYSTNNSTREITGEGNDPIMMELLLSGIGKGDSCYIYLSHPSGTLPRQNCIVDDSQLNHAIYGDTVVDVWCQDFYSASIPFKVTYTGVASLSLVSNDDLLKYTYKYDVDCDGDGTYEVTDQESYYTCDYSTSPGTHTIGIKGLYPVYSIDPQWQSLYAYEDHNVTVLAWGDQQWLSLEDALSIWEGHVTIAATDMPDLRNTVTMKGMFREVNILQDSGNRMKDWDTSNVADMGMMFFGIHPESTDGLSIGISSWDTSKVSNMSEMFALGRLNPDISSWNVSKVQDMSFMFNLATKFNRDISDWDTSSVIIMEGMFSSDPRGYEWGGEMIFNQALDTWDVGSVINMDTMFKETVSFDQDLSAWDVSGDPLHVDFATGSPIAGTAKEPNWP